MAFTTMDQVLAALPGQPVKFNKNFQMTSGAWASTFNGVGYPTAGATPSSGLAGDIPTAATLGALPMAASGPGTLYAARMQAGFSTSGQAGLVVLYDRVWHNSGISATVTTAQTINSVALNRPDANGKEVEAWWQVYAAMGAGTPNVTLTYTDQDGNTAQSGSSGVLATTMAVNRTGPFILASGDTGVRSIQTWQADATFTSGTIGLVLRRPLLYLAVPVFNQEQIADVLASNLVEIPDAACLEIVTFVQTTTLTNFQGELLIVEG